MLPGQVPAIPAEAGQWGPVWYLVIVLVVWGLFGAGWIIRRVARQFDQLRAENARLRDEAIAELRASKVERRQAEADNVRDEALAELRQTRAELEVVLREMKAQRGRR